MKRSRVGSSAALVALVAILAAACGGEESAAEALSTAAATTESDLGPSSEQDLFGHIESLARVGDHFELRFDPAWFLLGVTANEAAAEDGAVEPGEPVPNDVYVVEEGHRLLEYVVPDDARVTVLTNRGDPPQITSTPITVSELAEVVQGTSRLELFEPLDSGVWITVDVDTVRAVEHQYRP